jgi:HMG (high mobility group) box
MTSNTDPSTVLSSAFRQLSEALHLASNACKDLEYTIPLLASRASVPAAPETKEKQKRVRDPDEPRRPHSAYLLFTNQARQDLSTQEPALRPAEVITKLAEMWSNLSETDRKVSL